MKRHDTDTISLVAGLLLVTVGVVWFIDLLVTLPGQAFGLIFAGVCVLIGVVGLLRLIRRPRAARSHSS